MNDTTLAPIALAMAIVIPIAVVWITWRTVSNLAEHTITRAIIRAAHELDRERRP